MLHKVLHVFLLLLAGGLATSLAEFHFQYNLIDLLKDKVLGLFGKAKADVAAAEADVKKHL